MSDGATNIDHFRVLDNIRSGSDCNAQMKASSREFDPVLTSRSRLPGRVIGAPLCLKSQTEEGVGKKLSEGESA